MSKVAHNGAYRPDIDGLRAIAVVAVVVFHAFIHNNFGGFIGVDVFFVISGYLISGIIFREIEGNGFSYVRFYSRRIRRIFPALIIVLISSIAMGWFILFDDEFSQLLRHVAASAWFVINLQLYSETGYFDKASAVKPLLHLWSLGVEEQFYIIWPPVLIALHRMDRGWAPIAYGLAALMVGSFACSLWLMNNDMSAAFYNPLSRGWELLAGAALALAEISGRLESVPTLLRQCGAWAGLAILVASLALINSTTPFPGIYAVPPVLASALMIGAGPNAWPNRLILSQPLMRWIGGISYPLYLWHWPVLVFAHLMAYNSHVSELVCVGLAVFLAWCSTTWIEQPLRFGGIAYRRTWQLGAGMAVLGVISLIFYTADIRSSNSFIANRMERQLGWQIPVATTVQISNCNHMFPERVALTSRQPENNFCMIQHVGQPDVAMIGDSLNLSLFPGLEKQNHHNIVLISASEAAPFYDTRTTERNDRVRLGNYRLTNQALDYAIAAPNIKIVILSFLNGDWFLTPRSALYIQDMSAEHATPGQPDSDAHSIFVRAMRRTLDRITASGKPVIFVLPNQRMPFDPLDCLSGMRKIHSPNYPRICAEPRRSLAEIRRLTYDNWVREVANFYPLVHVFDLAAPFCDDHYCYASKDGKMFYRDQLHLSIEGSDFVAPTLLQTIDGTFPKH